MSETIYKYVNTCAAEKILTNRSLRFGRPSEMNDPFDVYISELFDEQEKDLIQLASEKAIEAIVHQPREFALAIGACPDQVEACAAAVQAGSQEQRSKLFSLTRSTIEANLEDAEWFRKLQEQRVAVTALFRNTGLFCATTRKDNLLMWAHYADQHRGAVLGFKPDADQDSFLCVLEPVRYSDERPKFGDPLSKPNSREFYRLAALTKSSHWSYEEELRVFVPSDIPDDQNETFRPFYPNELTELYLGLRMGVPERDLIVKLARLVNPDVKIYGTFLSKGTFELSFERLD